ncbi:MAG: nuclear transport factor 2 family protein [Alphaproteobacteria bacterium]|nr:nuclear transport factor 2 family protein [Alphaproteobacteria bacterium]
MDAEAVFRIEHACARLIRHYANLNDAGRWEDVADLYTEDAIFCRPSAPDEEIHGRAAILSSFLARPGRMTGHLVTNIVVDVASDREAAAFSRIVLYQADPAPDGPVARHTLAQPLIGTFTARLVLLKAGWRFSERRGSLTIR